MKKTLLTLHNRVERSAGRATLLTPVLAATLGLLGLAPALGQQRASLRPDVAITRQLPVVLAATAAARPEAASPRAARRGILAAIASTATGGNWSNPTTWTGGVVPTTTDDVTIVAGATVTLDVAAAVGSLTVAATGALLTSATTAYQLQVAGSVTNNGTLDLSSSATIGSELRFTGAGSVTFGGTGTTDLQTVALAKAARTDVVELNLPTLSVKGSTTTGDGFLTTSTTGSTPADDMTGTLKISGTATISNKVFASAPAYIVPATGGFWLNNANFTVAGQTGSLAVNGLLRVSAGTFNVGTSIGNSVTFGSGAVYTQEGGTVNVAGLFSNSGLAITFTMSGGTLNNMVIGSTSANSSFGLFVTMGVATSAVVVNISGGNINLVNRNGAATPGLDYNVTGTPAITGGTLQVGTAATAINFNFRLNGYTPSIVVDNTGNAKTATLAGTSFNFGTLLVTAGATFDIGAATFVQVGPSITNNGTFLASTAASGLYFQGTVPQTLGGTGTYSVIRSLSIDNSGGGVTLLVPVVAARVNLFTGNLNGTSNLTVGDGTAIFFVIQIGTTGNTGTSGSLASAPAFNIGSGALQLVYAPETTVRTTGFEIPTTRTVDVVLIANPAGVILAGSNLTISGVSDGSLILSSGILTTSAANTVVLGPNAGAIPTGSATSYVKGPLGITVNSATAVARTFAVGDAAGWRPVVVAGITASTNQTFTATVVSGATGGTGVSPVTNLNPARYVRLQNSASLPATATVQLSYGADDVLGNAATAVVVQAPAAAGTYASIGGAVATAPTTGVVSTLALTPGNDFFVLANSEGGTLTSSVGAVCAGTNSGTLTLANNVGTIVKYQADNGSGFADVAGTNTSSTLAFSNLTATTTFRAVILTSDNRTVYSTPVTVTVNPAPTATLAASTPTTFCGPGTLTLAATPVTGATYQYQLNGANIAGATSANYSATVSTSGSYTVIVTSASGCSTTSAPVAVTVNPATTATFAYTGSTFCQSGTNPTATVTGTTGGTFTSTTGLTIDVTTGTINLAASTLGTYIVTYSVGGTCPSSATASVTITSAPMATFSYATAAYCVGGTANPAPVFATGASAGTFSSTTGLVINATTGVIDLATSTAGTYMVTNSISASGGCAAASATASVTINAAPTAVITTTTPTTFCQGGAVLLTATGGTSYQFLLNGTAISGATSATYSATASGAYSVLVTNASGCSATSTATTVMVNPATTATFAYTGSTFCVSGTNPTATVTGTTGGTFASTTGLTIDATTGAITLTSSTPSTYTVTYSVGGTCPSSGTASVTITAAPVASFSYASAAYCVSGTNPTAVVPATSTAGMFSSTTGLTINATTGAITLASSTSGTYTVTNTVAASGGCAVATATTSVTITATPTATLTAGGATTFCQGGAVVLTAPAGTGNTYQFQLNGANIVGATSATYSATANGAYTVVVTNAGACSATSAATTLVVNALPATPTLSAQYNGANITLTSSAVTGNQFYLNGVAIAGATSQTYVVNGTTAQLGSYTVVTTNANGCASAASSPLVVTSSVKPLTGSSLNVYPNPTPDGKLSVELTGYRKAVELTVFNTLGQLVFTATVPASAGMTTKSVDLTQLASGVYILRAKTEGGLDTRRIVKQ